MGGEGFERMRERKKEGEREREMVQSKLVCTANTTDDLMHLICAHFSSVLNILYYIVLYYILYYMNAYLTHPTSACNSRSATEEQELRVYRSEHVERFIAGLCLEEEFNNSKEEGGEGEQDDDFSSFSALLTNALRSVRSREAMNAQVDALFRMGEGGDMSVEESKEDEDERDTGGEQPSLSNFHLIYDRSLCEGAHSFAIEEEEDEEMAG